MPCMCAEEGVLPAWELCVCVECALLQISVCHVRTGVPIHVRTYLCGGHFSEWSCVGVSTARRLFMGRPDSPSCGGVCDQRVSVWGDATPDRRTGVESVGRVVVCRQTCVGVQTCWHVKWWGVSAGIRATPACFQRRHEREQELR